MAVVIAALLAFTLTPVGSSSVAASSGTDLIRGWAAIGQERTIQESDSTLTYHGRWFTAYYPAYLGGAVRSTNTVDSSVTLSFKGTGIAWIGPIGPTRGTARVYVDGRLAATVNCYASSFQPTQALFHRVWDVAASHAIKIVAAGTRGHPTVGLDAFVVRGELRTRVTTSSGTTTAAVSSKVKPGPRPPNRSLGGTSTSPSPISLEGSSAAPSTTPAPTVSAAPVPAPTGLPTPAPTAPPTLSPTPAPTPAPSSLPSPSPAPTSAPSPSPSATPRIVTVGPSESVSAFRSLAADLSVDVIEMTAGAYHNWRAADLPDRTGHPLTIRPAAGATVVFDAANDGNYGDRAFGLLNASYITFDGTPGRFVFQHYLIAQDGMFLLINASHITVKGVTFSHIAGNAKSNSESSHLFYVSHGVSYLDIEDVTASHLLASDEPGGVYGVSGIQLYTGGSGPAIHDVTVRSVSISDADWGVVVRNGSSGLLFDGVVLSDCGNGGVPAALDLGTDNTGTVRNSTTTLSVRTPSILGKVTNGGGNTFQ